MAQIALKKNIHRKFSIKTSRRDEVILFNKKKSIKRRSNLTQNAIDNIMIGTHEHCHHLKSKQKIKF